jgi:hypothetical protein
MDDAVDAAEHLEQSIRQASEELRAMGVGDHTDADGHLGWARIETTSLIPAPRLTF